MSRKIYIGTDVSKKIKALYVGISGSSRRIKSAYIGVNGLARKFYPYLYHWNQYSLQFVYLYDKYTIKYQNVASLIYYGTGRLDSGWSVLNDSIGARTMSFDRYTGLITLSDIFTISSSSTIYKDWWATSLNKDMLNMYYTGCVAGTYEANQVYDCIDTGSVTAIAQVPSVEWSQEAIAGDYIERIVTTSSSTYPSNGMYNGYWYISRGATFQAGEYITSLYSEDRNAYPDNAQSGNYWYVYQGEA